MTQLQSASSNGQEARQSSSAAQASMRLLLICHAQGMHDRYTHLGNDNSGLTARGWEQSDVLARWLATHTSIDTLVCDSLLQSRLTAQRLGQTLGLPVSVNRELPRCPRGGWNAAPAEVDILKHVSNVWQQPVPVEAKSYGEFCAQLIDVLDKLLIDNWGHCVALVTCGDSIVALIRHLFGTHHMDIQVDHTSITEVSQVANRWRMGYLNRMPHLPSPEIVSKVSAEEKRRPLEEIEDLSAVVQVYNRVASADLEQKVQEDRARFQHLLNFAKVSAESAVLDVGTGLGLLPLVLAENGVESIIGVDVSPTMLERAEYFRLSQPPEIANRISFRLAPAQVLPFHDDRFDVVICRLLLHHARKPERIVSEIVRVLKPGGTLILAEQLSVDNPVKRATHNTIEERRNPSHVAARNAEQYSGLLTAAGLEITATEIAVFDREVEEWLSVYQVDKSDANAVREMIEAGLETDAAGINPRRQGSTVIFEQRFYYVRATKPEKAS